MVLTPDDLARLRALHESIMDYHSNGAFVLAYSALQDWTNIAWQIMPALLAAAERAERLEGANSVMSQAIRRYLELAPDCDFVEGTPEVCPGVEETGAPCHWCQLRAALQQGEGEAGDAT